jgi:Tol biopolymer transport system component
MLTLILAVVAAALAFGARDRDVRRDLTRFVVAPPAGTTIGVPENMTRIAISPDGRRLALVVLAEARRQIWIHSLDSNAAEPLAGTENGVSPFWSPDSRFIGFFSLADGQLKKVDVTGGPAITICAAEMEGAPVWGRDGTILFTQAALKSSSPENRYR